MLFNVTLIYRNKAGNRTKWTGEVEAVPGEDIFATACRTFAKRAKKGMNNLPRLIAGQSFAVKVKVKLDPAPAANVVKLAPRRRPAAAKLAKAA